MAFHLSANRTFTRRIAVAGDEDFVATYRVRSEAEVGVYDFDDRESENQFLRDTVVTLDEIEGTDGPLAYDVALLDQMLGFPDVRLGLLRGYREGLIAAISGN